MANFTRRITDNHDPVLQDLIRTAPRGVRWKRNSWQAIRKKAGTEWPEIRQFSAGTIGYAAARQREIDWQNGKEVPRRYDGFDRARVKRRQLALSKRVLKGKIEPRYELAIQASNAGSGNGWMKIYLGTAKSVTQDRIDRAVATLHARMDLFRNLVTTVGQEAAAAEVSALQVDDGPPQTQLLLTDVLAWNGIGNGVSYSPRVNAE